MIPPSGRSSTRRRTVLVLVEDELTRTFIVDALGTTSEVIEARDTATAVDLLGAADGRLDIVVGHCPRPAEAQQRSACVAFVRTVYRRWPWIPVVIVSGSTDTEQLVAEVLVTGVRDVLRMPITPAHLAAAVQRLAAASGARKRSTPTTIARIERILEFLSDNVGQIPDLDELAAMVTMSPSHLSHTFRAVAGMPLRDYVRHLQLRLAHELLITSKLSLTMVAVESGFYDLPHFDKTFRHRFGMSPQRFRTLHAKAPPAPG